MFHKCIEIQIKINKTEEIKIRLMKIIILIKIVYFVSPVFLLGFFYFVKFNLLHSLVFLYDFNSIIFTVLFKNSVINLNNYLFLDD